MAELRIDVVHADGVTTYQVVATDDGITNRRKVGPKFHSPRSAALFMDRELSKHLNPSPLRHSGEDSSRMGSSPERLTALE